jgi:hypothetical protein
MPARVQASLKLFRMADNLPPALFAKTSSEQGCRGYSARREVMNFSSGLILIPDSNGEPRHIPMDSSSICDSFRVRTDAGRRPLASHPIQPCSGRECSQPALGRIENSGKIVRASGNKNMPHPASRALRWPIGLESWCAIWCIPGQYFFRATAVSRIPLWPASEWGCWRLRPSRA